MKIGIDLASGPDWTFVTLARRQGKTLAMSQCVEATLSPVVRPKALTGAYAQGWCDCFAGRINRDIPTGHYDAGFLDAQDAIRAAYENEALQVFIADEWTRAFVSGGKSRPV